MNAPQALMFDLGLSADFDGDTVLDAVAWAVPIEPNEASPLGGELWYYPGRSANPRRVAQLPGFVPAGPGCQVRTDLRRTGPKTVTLDNRATCQASLVPRAPTRGVQVVAPDRKEPRVFGVRVADPAPGETLDLRVDTSDRDGDGRDDIDLRVSVGAAGSKQPASGHLIWLDRAAGPSREQDEPARSLAAAASLEQVRAKGKKTSTGVPSAVANIRRLTTDLCAESATPRVWDWDGSPFRCPGLQPTLDRLALAEVQSALARGDTVEAFSSLARDGWYIGSASPKAREALERLLRAALVTRQVIGVVTLSDPPAAPPAWPHLSPLTFGADGTLYLQGPGGTVRTFGPNGESEPERAGETTGGTQPREHPAWTLEARSDSGERLTDAVYSCDRSEVVLSVAKPQSSSVEPLPTTVLSPRPGACGRWVAPIGPRALAVGWSQAGVVACVGGSIVGPGSVDEVRRSPPAGSPLSPDGQWLVVPAALGVLVTGPKGAELWTLPGLDTLRALSGCVVANGAARAACLRDGHAVLLTPGAQ